jgi:hypothetical protein
LHRRAKQGFEISFKNFHSAYVGHFLKFSDPPPLIA